MYFQIVAGTEITTWRTAAASIVATKHIYKPLTTNKLILAILGAGTQGEIHAVAFAHFYNFVEVLIVSKKYLLYIKTLFKHDESYN